MANDNAKQPAPGQPPASAKSAPEVQSSAPVNAAPSELSKADKIRASAMPQAQKDAYLKEIGEGVEGPQDPASLISFDVFCVVAGIKSSRKKAMLVYPKAVGVKSATLVEWKEIFKGF